MRVLKTTETKLISGGNAPQGYTIGGRKAPLPAPLPLPTPQPAAIAPV